VRARGEDMHAESETCERERETERKRTQPETTTYLLVLLSNIPNDNDANDDRRTDGTGRDQKSAGRHRPGVYVCGFECGVAVVEVRWVEVRV
jgi:hypothetical protein